MNDAAHVTMILHIATSARLIPLRPFCFILSKFVSRNGIEGYLKACTELTVSFLRWMATLRAGVGDWSDPFIAQYFQSK